MSISREPVESEVVQITADVYQEPEYVYTIIGTWAREFDGHTEEYVFTADSLTTHADGVMNGFYDIEYTEDWTFILLDTVFDYELLHSADMDVLILGGYQYVRMD
jgi:hypothetical protein